LKRKRLLPIFITLIVIAFTSIPSLKSSAQNSEEKPDFIVTLALMAVSDDRLDTLLDTSDLANMRDMVDDYYKVLPYSQMDEEKANSMRQEKSIILASLDSKIDYQNSLADRSLMVFSAAMVLGHDPDKINYEGHTVGADLNYYETLLEVLSAKHTPDPAVVALLKARLERDSQSTLQKNLDGHVAATVENGDQLIAQNSGTTYDFTAGLSKEAYLDQLRQTKSLVFINNGARDVQVIVEYYAPPEGVAISAPGLNLTVPGENSVMANGFPQGNYTFCVDWQTDMDTDGDGFKDFDKMVTHIWLSSAHSDDPGMAEEVYVNSVGTATPLGRCDGFKGESPETEIFMTELLMTEDDPQQWIAAAEIAEDIAAPPSDTDFWDQGEGSSEEEGDPQGGSDPGEESPSTELTTAELSNQGQHTYSVSGYYGEEIFEPEIESHSFEFTVDGVCVTDEEGEDCLGKKAPNVYSDNESTITFTESGWVSEGYLEFYDGVSYPYKFTGTLIQ